MFVTLVSGLAGLFSAATQNRQEGQKQRIAARLAPIRVREWLFDRVSGTCMGMEGIEVGFRTDRST